MILRTDEGICLQNRDRVLNGLAKRFWSSGSWEVSLACDKLNGFNVHKRKRTNMEIPIIYCNMV